MRKKRKKNGIGDFMKGVFPVAVLAAVGSVLGCGTPSGQLAEKEFRTEKGFAQVNGARLYYEVAGSGTPLVLIHGFSLDTRMWSPQWEVFAEHYRVVRYDARGFGKSSLPGNKPYSHAEDLKALLEYLKIPRAHVLGLSKGGGIAVDFTLAFPEIVSVLVVVDSSPRGFDFSKKFFTSMEPILEKAEAGDLEAVNKLWMEHALLRPAKENPKVAAQLEEMLSDYSGWHWVNSNPLKVEDPPASERLEEITVPTLILLGERDLQDIHRISRIMDERIPNSQRVVLPGVGHMANMEAPERFNEIVLNFLGRNPDQTDLPAEARR